VGKLRRISGKEMVRLLEKRGYLVVRIRGSHHFLEAGEHRTSVPVHGSRPLKIGTLRSILRDIGMSPTEFAQLVDD
jgi:predicted RNA binding protein YcfA (HicA-like mRNA interferase family)